MRIQAITVTGLRSGDIHHEAGDELTSGPLAMSLADGLSLVAVALDAEASDVHLRALEIGGRMEEADGLPEGLVDLDAVAVDRLIQPGTPRVARVELSLHLDPLLFRVMREHGGRDADLRAALAAGAPLRLRAAWLWSRSGDHASVTLPFVALGDHALPAAPRERPPWLAGMLRSIARRIGRLHVDEPLAALAARLQEIAWSDDPELRRRWERLTEARVPGLPGALTLVRRAGQVELAVGPALLPLRAHGPRAALAARIAAAVLVDQPDVLVLPHPLPDDDPLVAWVHAHTDGDQATLEQVLAVTPSDGAAAAEEAG